MPTLLDGLAEPFTPIGEATARDALAGFWGLQADRLTRLDTERDDTFRAEFGSEVVTIKVAHPNDDPVVIAMQGAAMAHALEADPGIPVQRIVPTLDGAPSVQVEGRVTRVLSWLDGDVVSEAQTSPALFEHAGRMLGRLNRALSDFRHPGADRDLAWDLPHLPDLREYATDPVHLDVIDRFGSEVAPVLAGLPNQVIHNDGHPGNLLARGERVVGILDFGDAVHSARVCDLAVALAYLVPDAPRPWADVDAFTAGFTAEVPLGEDELALLPMLIAARTIMRSLINQALERDAHADPHGFSARNDRTLRHILETA